jgi:hypothetical protein
MVLVHEKISVREQTPSADAVSVAVEQAVSLPTVTGAMMTSMRVLSKAIM